MRLRWIFPTLALILSACASPTPAPTGVSAPSGPMPSGSLGNLVGGAITQEEAALRDLQKRPNEINFPVKLGVLFYGYQTALKPEDQTDMMSAIGKDLVASGLVKEMIRIPESMLKGGDNLDAIRKLSASFQVDALLLVSGTNSFERSANQPLGFFDSFTNQAFYEARSNVTAIAMNIYSGTFLDPFQVVGVQGPTKLDYDAANYADSVYAMRKQAEATAFDKLKADLLTSLAKLKATAVPPGSASPSPSPSPSAS